MKPLLVLPVLFFLNSFSLHGAGKPNIVIFLADDQGWGDLSASGNVDLSTPHIDSLARDGVCIDRFFVCPVCAPTRAEFLTGRYHARTGVTGVSSGEERLNVDEHTLGEAFRTAGYATGAFGKWHNGTQFPNHPNGRGFDEFYGFTSGHWGHYFSPMLDHNGTFVTGEGYITDDLTNKAMAFIDAQAKAGKPFLAYLAYCTPHSPMQVPDEYWDRFASKELKMHDRDPKKEQPTHMRAALAMCENIDWNVGRVLAQLESLGIVEDTIVIYFSDNGPNGARWNGGMRGRKGSTDEGGVRVPFFIRWPGHLPSGHVVKKIAGAIDLLPTLANMAGISLPKGKPLDGMNIEPLLMNATDSWPDRMIFSNMGNRVSVRTDRHRLSDRGALFDMIDDPGQNQDLAKAKPKLRAELIGRVTEWKSSVWPDGYRKIPRPFLVGYPGSLQTQLPVRDAKSQGGIKRASIHPNCSFFTHWTGLEDRITWEVEVVTEGDYEIDASLYLSASGCGLGGRVELLGRDRGRGGRDSPRSAAGGCGAGPASPLGGLGEGFPAAVTGRHSVEKGQGDIVAEGFGNSGFAGHGRPLAHLAEKTIEGIPQHDRIFNCHPFGGCGASGSGNLR